MECGLNVTIRVAIWSVGRLGFENGSHSFCFYRRYRKWKKVNETGTRASFERLFESSQMKNELIKIYLKRILDLEMHKVSSTFLISSDLRPLAKCNERMSRNRSANNKLTGWLEVVTSFKNVAAICSGHLTDYAQLTISPTPPLSRSCCLSCFRVMSRIIKRPADKCINWRPDTLRHGKEEFSPRKYGRHNPRVKMLNARASKKVLRWSKLIFIRKRDYRI